MLIRVLRAHLRPYRRLLLAVILLQSVQAVASLYLPTLNARVIDEGVIPHDTGYIWRVGMIMLLVTLVQVTFNIVAVYFGSRAAMGFGRDVRSSLFHRVTEFSAREVNVFGAPSLITRITNDVQQVQMLVTMTLTMLISAPITIIGGLIMALRQDAGLTWLLGVTIILLVFSLSQVVLRMVPTFRLMQERIDGINRVLREQITGMRVVRAFVREPEEVGRFDFVNEQVTETSLKAGRLMSFMFPTVLLIINVSCAAVVWFGSNRVASGATTVGSLIAFLTYFTVILFAVMMVSWVGFLAPRAAVSAERIQEVLETASSVTVSSNPVGELTTAGSLEFRDVSFGYPGAEAPVLSGITFRSVAGQTTAVVGSTGSGKTTLVNLVARLFDVTEGSVLVGGVDVRDLDPHVLWTRIGLVPQKPYLFSGTVASNLRYGKPNATDEELWEALQIAQASDFVAAMPGGLDASIVQGGANVSGGQRQRLAIARALVRKPDIYLFDDSFSALDLATDARLRAALEPYTRQATVIVVAQRISTIATADQILVIEDGVPVGLGTHADLLETCATYVEIVESQTQGAAA
ncbi:MAG TPA: ABC transporter ATP-binding protein [Acidimicrobiales bacterium]|nr:ABC transporter ATP-binding protein [Acidimicrobiales bacterium]